MNDLEPIEEHLRDPEDLDSVARLVVRGWPLSDEGLLRNADATRSRFSLAGRPFAAISVEVTMEGWTLDRILAGPRMGTRSRYATTAASHLLGSGYELFPTFACPHYSVLVEPYTSERVEQFLGLLGEVQVNPHHVRRQR